jgi:DMSO reductase family type II enzyme molybdopterin subunit
MNQLACWPGTARRLLTPDIVPYRSWEDLYRRKWTWDKITYGTHLVDCYPGSCLWRVYTKQGVVWREEQAATYPQIESDIPDMNPRGCQKGGCFSHVMQGAERLRYPLKRAGERGEGKWVQISWDEALTEIADAIVDTLKENGPDSLLLEYGPEGGVIHGASPPWRLVRLLGGVVLDHNAAIGDYSVGLYETFGKFQFVSSVDDWYNANLILIWHSNPVYTKIPCAHYLNEARYNGTQIVSISPDYNASGIHADLWVPVEPGSDAALALAMCKLIIDEGRHNQEFIKEQTDLAFLVRQDDGHFLRESDLKEKGRDDQFYFWDAASGEPHAVPRDTLRLPVDPALDGAYSVTLLDGKQVEVTPAFEILRKRLQEYTPEQAAAVCHTTAATVRKLANMVAEAKAVTILQGFNINKYYHGDLMERSQALLLALTGNFGRRGTGMRGWNSSQLLVSHVLKRRTGMEGFLELAKKSRELEVEALDKDPTLTPEMVAIESERDEVRRSGMSPLTMSNMLVPPFFYWYYHCGYNENWNKPEWSDPAMKRSFDEYFREAIDSGWWEDLVRPAENTPPRVYLGVACSTLRRTRGGFKLLRENLWPKLKLIVSVDLRMSTTACFSDIVLPAAGYYEKVDFRFPVADINFLTFTDKAVKPLGESKPEWEIFALLAKKVQERAKAKGFTRFKDGQDKEYRLDQIYRTFTMEGTAKEKDEEKLANDIIADTIRVGALPERTSLKTFRDQGIVRLTGLGMDAVGMNMATDIKPNETIAPLRWHVEDKTPYPTLTRRIQFYIDHDWFLEADEQLPRHKPNPLIGGDYPLRMTSGHLRWSIHSVWAAQKLLLQTHRGEPNVFMNPKDAERRGIEDNDLVRIYNDFDSCKLKAKLAPSVRPGQVIVYHAWEPYQYPDWKPYDSVAPGMIKWLHMAGGYGHLNYWRWNWIPQQFDRATPVEAEKAV